VSQHVSNVSKNKRDARDARDDAKQTRNTRLDRVDDSKAAMVGDTGDAGVAEGTGDKEEDAKSSQQVADWIEKKVGDIIEYKTSTKEMDRLLTVMGKLNREREEVLAEIEPLSIKILLAESKLRAKISEIEGKIVALKVQSKEMEVQLEQDSRNGDGGTGGTGGGALRGEWEELQVWV
jgi:hypothetical protein